MGWIAIFKDNTIQREGEGVGRPVDAGNNGELLCIAQEDYGHKIAVDLVHGIIAFDYETLSIQNNTIELGNVRTMIWMCEETSLLNDMKNLKQEFLPWFNCNKTKFVDVDGERREVACEGGSTDSGRCENNHKRKPVMHEGVQVNVRNDILTDLQFRPIWFTRNIGGVQYKVIGAQVTTPEVNGGRNVKKLVTMFPDGRLGVD